MPEAAQAFTKVLGRPVRYVRIGLETARNTDLRAMLEWFEKGGYQVDIPALRRIRPDMLTLEDWLEKHRQAWQRTAGPSR